MTVIFSTTFIYTHSFVYISFRFVFFLFLLHPAFAASVLTISICEVNETNEHNGKQNLTFNKISLRLSPFFIFAEHTFFAFILQWRPNSKKKMWREKTSNGKKYGIILSSWLHKHLIRVRRDGGKKRWKFVRLISSAQFVNWRVFHWELNAQALYSQANVQRELTFESPAEKKKFKTTTTR